jgi:peptidyl-prolyl cis-trans isomerase C
VLGASAMHVANADEQTELLRVGETSYSVAAVKRELSRAPREPTTEPSTLLEEWLIPRLLREHRARQRVQEDADFASTLKPASDFALQRALEQRFTLDAKVTDADITAFYERHRHRYQRPLAIKIWRILIKDTDSARRVLGEVQGNKEGAAKWKTLARELSLDTATHLRGGDLGFVREDGNTDVPEVRVNRSLFEAASKVKDGELVAEPMPEGEYFAVIWRRGTRPAENLPLNAVTENIRRILQRDQAGVQLDALIQRLRGEHLKSFHPELLEGVSFPPHPGFSVTRPQLEQRAASDPTPRAEHGER